MVDRRVNIDVNVEADRAARGSEKAARSVDKLGDELNQTGKQADRANRELNELGSAKTLGGIGGLGKAVVGLAVAMGGLAIVHRVADGFKRLIGDAIELGDTLQKTAIRTGASVEFLSGVGFAAEQSGSNFQEFSVGVRRLARTMSDAENELSTAVRSFADVGVSATTASGRLKSVEEILPELADSFARMEDETKAAALAQELFGRGGVQLLPLLRQGSEGIAELRAEAERLGIVFGRDFADSAAEARDALNRARQAAIGLKTTLAAQVLPTIADLADTLSEKLADPAVQDQIERLGKSLANAVENTPEMLERLPEVIRQIGEALEGAAKIAGLILRAANEVGKLTAAKREREAEAQRVGEELFGRGKEAPAPVEPPRGSDSFLPPQEEIDRIIAADEQRAREMAEEIARLARIQAEFLEDFGSELPERPLTPREDVGVVPPPEIDRIRQGPGPVPADAPDLTWDEDVAEAAENVDFSMRDLSDTMIAFADVVAAVTGDLDSTFQRVLRIFEGLARLFELLEKFAASRGGGAGSNPFDTLRNVFGGGAGGAGGAGGGQDGVGYGPPLGSPTNPLHTAASGVQAVGIMSVEPQAAADLAGGSQLASTLGKVSDFFSGAAGAYGLAETIGFPILRGISDLVTGGGTPRPEAEREGRFLVGNATVESEDDLIALAFRAEATHTAIESTLREVREFDVQGRSTGTKQLTTYYEGREVNVAGQPLVVERTVSDRLATPLEDVNRSQRPIYVDALDARSFAQWREDPGVADALARIERLGSHDNGMG